MLLLATGYRHEQSANVADSEVESTLAAMKSHPDAQRIMVWRPGEDCESDWLRDLDGNWTNLA